MCVCKTNSCDVLISWRWNMEYRSVLCTHAERDWISSRFNWIVVECEEKIQKMNEKNSNEWEPTVAKKKKKKFKNKIKIAWKKAIYLQCIYAFCVRSIFVCEIFFELRIISSERINNPMWVSMFFFFVFFFWKCFHRNNCIFPWNFSLAIEIQKSDGHTHILTKTSTLFAYASSHSWKLISCYNLMYFYSFAIVCRTRR